MPWRTGTARISRGLPIQISRLIRTTYSAINWHLTTRLFQRINVAITSCLFLLLLCLLDLNLLFEIWEPARLDLPLAPRGFSLANVGTLVAPTDCQTCPNFFSIASFATLNMKWGAWGLIDALVKWVTGNACLGVIKWLLVTFTSETKNGLDSLLTSQFAPSASKNLSLLRLSK